MGKKLTFENGTVREVSELDNKDEDEDEDGDDEDEDSGDDDDS